MKTKAELIKENEHLKHLMRGIISRCAPNCPPVKDNPASYYRGRLAMIQLVAEGALKD